MSTAKWQNITGSKKFFNFRGFSIEEKEYVPEENCFGNGG